MPRVAKVASEKICSICGNPFTPASNRQTYCNSCKPNRKRQPVEVTPEDEAAAAEILALITQADETAEPAPQEAKPEAKMEPAPVPTSQAPAPAPLAEAIRLLTAEAQDLEKRLEVTRRKLDTLSSADLILRETLDMPSSTGTA